MERHAVGREVLTVATCHTPDCGRPTVEGLPLCASCRLSYLNGVIDGRAGKGAPIEELCRACGHFKHVGTPCGWHGLFCDDAVADPSLWCRCNGTHPLGGPPDGRRVHAAWRDGMLAQGRTVEPGRMSWETLSVEDKALDGDIARRLAGEPRPKCWRNVGQEAKS